MIDVVRLAYSSARWAVLVTAFAAGYAIGQREHAATNQRRAQAWLDFIADGLDGWSGDDDEERLVIDFASATGLAVPKIDGSR